jgi:hypothetical protein
MHLGIPNETVHSDRNTEANENELKGNGTPANEVINLVTDSGTRNEDITNGDGAKGIEDRENEVIENKTTQKNPTEGGTLRNATEPIHNEATRYEAIRGATENGISNETTEESKETPQTEIIRTIEVTEGLDKPNASKETLQTKTRKSEETGTELGEEELARSLTTTESETTRVREVTEGADNTKESKAAIQTGAQKSEETKGAEIDEEELALTAEEISALYVEVVHLVKPKDLLSSLAL